MNTNNVKFPPEVVFGNFDEEFEKFVRQRRVIVITDANVHLYNRVFVDKYEHIVIGQGEVSKTMHTADDIVGYLATLGADRETLLVGMGGGIVTDITGFVASIYMRGISFGFIPTTLLAQVDASIGGKNGVNLAGYKNMIGTFSRPEFVIIDNDLLSTLAPRDFVAGMAEVIKVAILGDTELFDIVETHSPQQIAADRELLEEVVKRSVAVKWNIVAEDEFETGNRRLLNLGHTFGHAIEKCTHKYNHGEAVAIGLNHICAVAERVGSMCGEDVNRIRSVIEKAGLPIDSSIEMDRLLSAIKLDKKRSDDSVYIILPNSIGQCDIVRMSMDDLEKYSQ